MKVVFIRLFLIYAGQTTIHGYTFVMKMMMFIMKTTIDIFKDNLLKNGVHRVYF